MTHRRSTIALTIVSWTLILALSACGRTEQTVGSEVGEEIED